MGQVAGPAPDAPEHQAFTNSTSTEALPEPVDASNARSVNRKPRVRRQYKLWETRQAKRMFLRTYRFSGEVKIAR